MCFNYNLTCKYRMKLGVDTGDRTIHTIWLLQIESNAVTYLSLATSAAPNILGTSNDLNWDHSLKLAFPMMIINPSLSELDVMYILLLWLRTHGLWQTVCNTDDNIGRRIRSSDEKTLNCGFEFLAMEIVNWGQWSVQNAYLK